MDDATDGARFTAEIEAAVYFCCAEAIQNAAKHCPDASVAVTLCFTRAAGAAAAEDSGADTGELGFAVADDGPGFDATGSTGSGMQNMADRIAAVRGTLNIESTLGEGTTVSGKVPAAPLHDRSEPSVDEDESAVTAGRL
jgi:signal transduction histidine kinase